MPDLDVVLREANKLLILNALPACKSIEAGADLDTANVNLIGHAEDRDYAIKVRVRGLATLERQQCVANTLRKRTGLPIPEHFCHSDPDNNTDALQLQVMEYMPGKQLRLLLRAIPEAKAEALTTDWGRCVAKFHTAELSLDECGGGPDLMTSHDAYLNWLRDKMQSVFQVLAANPGWPSDEVAAFEAYLAQRGESLAGPAVPGLRKRDQGLRDALAMLEPEPHVSALVDWEQVEQGDTIAEMADLFVMIYVAGLGRLWPAFREGYEAEAGPIENCDQLEYYAMARTLIAFTWDGQDAARIDQSLGLSRRLLKGESLITR
jgi:hypothetical protein